MTTTRHNSTLAMIVAVVAFLAASEASAEFIRVDANALIVGDDARLAGIASISSEASMSPATSPAEKSEDRQIRPALRSDLVNHTSDMCGPPAANSSSGLGPTSCALAAVWIDLPPSNLISRLPHDRDPAFTAPPPWTPLEPPRS